VTVLARLLLRPASLEVGTGDLVALIGPSGSGKTTLMRALADVSDGSSWCLARTAAESTRGQPFRGRPCISNERDSGELRFKPKPTPWLKHAPISSAGRVRRAD